MHRLACPQCGGSIVCMRIRRGGYINRIHLRVVNKLLRVRVPPRHPMPLGIALCFRRIPPHHRYQLRMFHLLECWTAFHLGYIPRTDNSTSYFHSSTSFSKTTTATLSLLALP